MSEAAGIAAKILESRAHGGVGRDVSLAAFTSYQLGGPAAVYLEAESNVDLAALGVALAESGLGLLIVGRGSNMLISDKGFDGIAVRLGAGFRWARVEGQTIAAGAAMPLPAIATLAGDASLSGIEFAMAIPASLGGAVAMNAGAHAHSMSEVVSTVATFDLKAGGPVEILGENIAFAYRSSGLGPQTVVTGATLRLVTGDPAQILHAMREARDWRRATQPIGLPNAGSVFVNPPGDAAGRLVEQVCGKAMTHRGARISEVHANFIVTSAGATADDVYSLLRRIQRAVAEDTGVTLTTEVKLIGEFTETSP